MLTRLSAGGFSLSGISVGGVYTTIRIAELNAVFDIGLAPRSFVGADYLFLSHGHADHLGSLAAHIGICGLSRLPAPEIFLPAELADDVAEALAALGRGQRRPLEVCYRSMQPGQERRLNADLWVRAYRTIHSVPSLAYLLFRRVNKLRPEFLELSPQELKQKREAGANLFWQDERPEVSYVTDSLIDVLDESPELTRSKCLILECTFLDERKPKEEARAKFHVHLDEILERAASFQCESLVLMHFSQTYSPSEVRRIILERSPPELFEKIRILAPEQGPWPG
jgi:ribonuclease Z